MRRRQTLSHGHCGTEQAQVLKEPGHQRSGVRRAADMLAVELRLLLRQMRELARLGVELNQASGRRYAG
jgi:hypothetical protein